MTPTRFAAGLLTVLAVGSAHAQSSPLGTYSLTTTYDDNQRRTETALRIRDNGPGRIKVDRTARFVNPQHSAEETFRWRGEGIQVSSTLLRVEFRVQRDGGFTGALSADDYRFRAIYRVNGDTIREVLRNETPLDEHAGWRQASSNGERDNGFVLAARNASVQLTGAVMHWRHNVADYYGPDDEDRYMQDRRELGFYFERALWSEVSTLPGFPAHKTLRAFNADRDEVIGEGAAYVLLDANAQVTETLYVDESGAAFNRFGEVLPGALPPSPPPVAPPAPAPPAPAPPVIDCPLGGMSVADLANRARAEASTAAGLMMDYYANVADYYSPGDEQKYEDDEAQLRDRLATSQDWAEAPVPAGYTAYKAMRLETSAGEEHITLLFDCNGRLLEAILNHFGDEHDTSDM